MTIKEMPLAYKGREQTWFKHVALERYLTQFGIKLGSWAGRRPGLKLWYSDVMAGPWKSSDEKREDTSISLALSTLKTAREYWRRKGYDFPVGAIFVEERPDAYRELQALCRQYDNDFEIVTLPGRFETHAARISAIIGLNNPAFVLVDPIGWTESPMRYVAQLAIGWRDVMVRVPSETYRFASRDNPAVVASLLSFFGLTNGDLSGLSEEEIIQLYCSQLKKQCGFRFAAEMVLPDPSRDRTAAWLAVGSNHPASMEVFRDAEHRVGRAALAVRDDAKRDRRGDDRRQIDMFPITELATFDPIYEERRERSLGRLPGAVEDAVRIGGDSGIRYGDLWPVLLERHGGVRRGDVADALRTLEDCERISIDRRADPERSISDRHVIRLARAAA